MRYLFLTIVAVSVLFIVGCAGDDMFRCYQAVKTKYPSADIVNPCGRNYEFIVKDSIGDIYYVYCGSELSPEPTVNQLIFKASKKGN